MDWMAGNRSENPSPVPYQPQRENMCKRTHNNNIMYMYYNITYQNTVSHTGKAANHATNVKQQYKDTF